MTALTRNDIVRIADEALDGGARSNTVVTGVLDALAHAGAPVTWTTHEGCETCGGTGDLLSMNGDPMDLCVCGRSRGARVHHEAGGHLVHLLCPDGRSVRWGDEP